MERTYNLNRLQRLDPATPWLVTLNPSRPPTRVHDRVTYTHPVYTTESVATQPAISALKGRHGTYFCGAHLGFGFHEDGLRSAVEAVGPLGGSLQ